MSRIFALAIVVLAIATAAVVAYTPGQDFAFSTGRIWWHRNESLYRFMVGSFDNSGVAFGVVSVGGGQLNLTKISVELMARTTEDNQTNQPHVFSAWLFEYNSSSALPSDPSDLSIPPLLSTATRHFNFSTNEWKSQEPVMTTLFEIDDPLKSYVAWVIKETEPDFNRRNFTPNECTFVSFSLTRNLSTSSSSSSSSSQRVSASRQQLLQQQQLPLRRQLQSIARQQQQQQQQQQRRRAEFFGDSITAGYCDLGKVPGENVSSWRFERYTATWSFLTSQHFRAAYHTVAWSGKGLVRNYEGEGPVTMSTINQFTCASGISRWRWPYNSSMDGYDTHVEPYRPQVVVINLGTNDFWKRNLTTNKSLVEQYRATYKIFLRNLSLWYGGGGGGGESSRLVVLLADGPMDLRFGKLLDEVKAWSDRALSSHGGLRAVRLTFPKFPKHSNDTHCDHPAAGSGHKIMARHLIRVIEKEVPGWKD